MNLILLSTRILTIIKNILLYSLASLGLLVIIAITVDDSEASCRSQGVKRKFDRINGFPNGRKGYIVDHICALECGGLDLPINMQYQTLLESKIKDRWERTPDGCNKTCNNFNSSNCK
jgi:hypothetical protein